MKTVAAIALLAGSASAFAPAQTSSKSTTSLDAMSKAVPFLTEPKNLKGYVGDVGFDPLGFSDKFDMKWLREAEIKHGRTSMLACLGFWQQQYVTLPGLTHVDDSNLAPSVVGASAMLQIVFWGGVMEFWTNKGNVTMETMFSDPDRVPGDLGFDPMGLSVGKSEEEKERMQLREIKNGRLAMLAIGGMIHHNWVTGDPLF
eukprot:CAMPEP_0178574156 /NCGR_PEP_ID=MMETSP0697-20121206/19190_1 /TAXON_ID=265572 /ORGANISM="Extubocellulus spinifer, Strain CCMP396" /LENGTH=200 /DNA_ID=CAMNT_0020209101 /DNA_START=29 /DNA_END=631 /DNA_ORIENTATION=-